MPNPFVISELRGRVTTTANLNLRQGEPNTSAMIARKVPRGTVLNVNKLVEGERIAGNGQWYGGEGNLYFWSGGVSPMGSDPAAFNDMPVPRRPNGTIQPLSEIQIRSCYGDIQVKELSGGRVDLDPAWVNGNIVTLQVPALTAIEVGGIQVHAKAVSAFKKAFDEIDRAGLGGTILTFGGTWVPRHKGWVATRSLSSHTWGIAIDLNVRWNGYGCVPAELGQHGSVRQLVSIFESAGFAWGGYFEPLALCDGMHFELALME